MACYEITLSGTIVQLPLIGDTETSRAPLRDGNNMTFPVPVTVNGEMEAGIISNFSLNTSGRWLISTGSALAAGTNA